MSKTKEILLKLIWGIALGFAVSRIGFANYDQVFAMFNLQDQRMFLAFISGALIMTVYFLAVRRSGVKTTRIHAGIVPGSIFFGIGWALTGGCPAVILMQIAHGRLPAVLTFAGVSLGMMSFRIVNTKFLRIDRGSC